MNESLAFALEPVVVRAEWRETHKGGAALRRLADAHYTRQTKGSNQFCRPGKNLCLLLSDGSAGWVVWRPLPEVGRMDGLEAWECTLFRNEGERLSSELIREATEWTYREWGWPPRDGLITAVGVEQTRRRRSKRSPPGKCFIEAGWEPMEKQGDGKVWLRALRPVRVAVNSQHARKDVHGRLQLEGHLSGEVPEVPPQERSPDLHQESHPTSHR